ncbi:MAG: hypothetical protein ABJF01_05345 [bacterium]
MKTKHTLRATLAALTVFAAGLIATPSGAQAPNACHLLTKAEITDISGMRVDTVSDQGAACIYVSKSPSASIQVRTYGPETSQGAERMCANGKPVSGVGDRACISARGPASTFMTSKGKLALVVVMFSPQKPNSDETLKQIAQKALSRM